MLRLPTIVACALIMGLAACATAPAPVRPIALAPGEWRVSLIASDARNARLGALREAAGLTLAEGGDWFRVLEREGAGAREPGAGPGLTSDLFADEDDISRRSLDIAIGHGPQARRPGHLRRPRSRHSPRRRGSTTEGSVAGDLSGASDWAALRYQPSDACRVEGAPVRHPRA